MGFTDKLDVGCEREKEIEDGFKVLVWETWRMELS